MAEKPDLFSLVFETESLWLDNRSVPPDNLEFSVCVHVWACMLVLLNTRHTVLYIKKV